VSTRAGITIAPPGDQSEHDAVKALFVEYAESLGFSLAYQSFERELSSFPGKYAPPTGALLLASADGTPAGAVGLRPLEAEICEIKRLYVRPAHRALHTDAGTSIGRALAVGIVAEARRLGYGRARLDTIRGKMDAAIRLYTSLGFVSIPAYYPSPVPDTLYMELVL
jgi:putative acetyltransferase